MEQQLQQPQHFIPIQIADRVIGLNDGILMYQYNPNKISSVGNALTANAALGISISASRDDALNDPVEISAAVETVDPNTTSDTLPTVTVVTAVETPQPALSTNPLVSMVQDVVFSMILHIPALRTKLQIILDNPSLTATEISKVHDELKSKLTQQELQQLNAYACQDSSRHTIGSVMKTAFANIMADGKIDMNDAPHFLTLIHDCITLFTTDVANDNSVALNSTTVITFLHFVIKCILILTLDGTEEDAALVMLDSSFKLVKLTVMPVIARKKWCSCFT